MVYNFFGWKTVSTIWIVALLSVWYIVKSNKAADLFHQRVFPKIG